MVYRSYVLAGDDASCGLAGLVRRVGRIVGTRTPEVRTALVYAGVDDAQSHTWKPKRGRRVIVTLTSEPKGGGRYVTVGADDDGEHERLHRALAATLSFWDLADLVKKARACRGDDAHWIVLMALAAERQPNPAVRKVIEKQLRSGIPSCCYNAAVAAGLVRWPELAPALGAALARFDPFRDGAGTRAVLAFAIQMTPGAG